MFWNYMVVVVQDCVNTLKSTELYTLKGWVFCYANYSQIKLLANEGLAPLPCSVKSSLAKQIQFVPCACLLWCLWVCGMLASLSVLCSRYGLCTICVLHPKLSQGMAFCNLARPLFLRHLTGAGSRCSLGFAPCWEHWKQLEPYSNVQCWTLDTGAQCGLLPSTPAGLCWSLKSFFWIWCWGHGVLDEGLQ
jgi:hypothetical protein